MSSAKCSNCKRKGIDCKDQTARSATNTCAACRRSKIKCDRGLGEDQISLQAGPKECLNCLRKGIQCEDQESSRSKPWMKTCASCRELHIACDRVYSKGRTPRQGKRNQLKADLRERQEGTHTGEIDFSVASASLFEAEGTFEPSITEDYDTSFNGPASIYNWWAEQQYLPKHEDILFQQDMSHAPPTAPWVPFPAADPRQEQSAFGRDQSMNSVLMSAAPEQTAGTDLLAPLGIYDSDLVEQSGDGYGNSLYGTESSFKNGGHLNNFTEAELAMMLGMYSNLGLSEFPAANGALVAYTSPDLSGGTTSTPSGSIQATGEDGRNGVLDSFDQMYDLTQSKSDAYFKQTTGQENGSALLSCWDVDEIPANLNLNAFSDFPQRYPEEGHTPCSQYSVPMLYDMSALDDRSLWGSSIPASG